MSAFASAPGQPYGDDPDVQRQMEEYQRRHHGLGYPPGAPPPNMDYYHGLGPMGLATSGTSPPHSASYAPQPYMAGPTHSTTHSSSPSMMTMNQGAVPGFVPPSSNQKPPPSHPPSYGSMPNYPTTFPGPAPLSSTGSFPYPSSGSMNPVAGSHPSVAIYSHPEPLTHPRAPKSTTTIEQIQLMQEAFKREQEGSRRRNSSSYVESLSARRVVRSSNTKPPGPSPPLPTTEVTKRPSPSPTSSTDSKTSLAVFTTTKKKDTAVLDQDEDGKPIVKDGDNVWFMGSSSLGVDDDKYWLSELQVYLRSHFAEAFAADEEDISVPMHGRNKPIALGQVGIRCMHCKNDSPSERGQQATSYPSLISGIYNSVQQMLRLHLDCCLSVPNEVRHKIEHLKLSCSSRGGRKQYWIDSAKRIGLVDTTTGIHFGRDPVGPLPPLSGPSLSSKDASRKKIAKVAPVVVLKKPAPPKPKPAPTEEPAEKEPGPVEEEQQQPYVDPRPVVFPEDRPLISDYLYLTMEQMAPCTLMESDRVGCYKTRTLGFPGLACRHCVGQAGCGRYFPATEASLSQTTTSQTILNHVRNCRRCPLEIREDLELMKRKRMGPDGKRSDKPKHGGRKVFFHRLWCRLQGLPIEESEVLIATESRGRKKRRGEEDDVYSDEETNSDGESDHPSADKLRRKSPNKKRSPLVFGCVRLTKADDPKCLTEMECFARRDLVEVFSYTRNDSLEGYNGRKLPAEGQVGVRCVFCKELDPRERTNGCIYFPDSLESIHSKVADMIRHHFTSCSALPDGVRQTFKSLRGFDAKVSTDDSHQYWMDAANDMGISNTTVRDAWGLNFNRDPLEPSPADEIDIEASTGKSSGVGAGLVGAEDRGTCTDQVFLLMRQLQRCRFKDSDQRSAQGSRGKERDVGFPGLSCIHCRSSSSQARYFPHTAKNLTDSTINSLLTHVMSCSHCPDRIKASLGYLGHRAIQQKTELTGSWKKNFFQRIWDRLHVDTDWEEDEGNHSAFASRAGDAGYSEGGGDEQGGDQMNALIKAAAIWLTEQDGSKPGSKRPADATESTEGSGSSPKRNRKAKV